MARKPLPTQIKLVKGTAQKCRTNQNEPKYEVQRVSVPRHLSPYAKSEWRRIVPELPVPESRPGETGAQDIGRQSFQSRLIVSINRRPAVNLKTRRVPAAQPMGEVPAEAAWGDQHLQDVVWEQPREHFVIEGGEGMKSSLPIPGSIADQRREVGVEIELVSVSLDGEDGAGSNSRVGEAGLSLRLERRPGTTRQLSEQPPIPPEGGTQDPGNGPHQLRVIDRFQDLLAHPLHEGRHALGLAGGTEVAGLARKGD